MKTRKTRKENTVLFSIDVWNRHKVRFAEIFGRRLHDFYKFPCGFEIAAFEKWLKLPTDGRISTESFVEENYGKEAAELIENLL